MRTKEEGDFGAKYKKAITADNNSRYAILTSSNLTYFPQSLLRERLEFSTMKKSPPAKPPHPKLVDASINYSCSACGSRPKMKSKVSPLFFKSISFQIFSAFFIAWVTTIWEELFRGCNFSDKVERKGLPNGAIYAAYVKFPTSFSNFLKVTTEQPNIRSIRSIYFLVSAVIICRPLKSNRK